MNEAHLRGNHLLLVAWMFRELVTFTLSGIDNQIIIWNVGTGQAMISLEDMHSELIYSAAWNRNGSLICTSCKDKAIRVIDPRKETIIAVSREPPFLPQVSFIEIIVFLDEVILICQLNFTGEEEGTRGFTTHESHFPV